MTSSILAHVRELHGAVQRARAEAASQPWEPPPPEELVEASAEDSQPGLEAAQRAELLSHLASGLEARFDAGGDEGGPDGAADPADVAPEGEPMEDPTSISDPLRPEEPQGYVRPFDEDHPDRPHFHKGSAELEALLRRYPDDRRALEDVLHEVSFRTSSGAQQMRATVQNRLETLRREEVAAVDRTSVEPSARDQPADQGASTGLGICPICDEHPAETTFRGKPVCQFCKKELRGFW